MDWNTEIKAWQERIDQKYTKEVEYENWEGEKATKTVFELPEQDITVLYSGKELCHFNGDYSNGCIKKAMQKTFIGKGKKRIEVEDIESNANINSQN
jgi:hypothetical protein